MKVLESNVARKEQVYMITRYNFRRLIFIVFPLIAVCVILAIYSGIFVNAAASAQEDPRIYYLALSVVLLLLMGSVLMLRSVVLSMFKSVEGCC